MDNRRTLLVVDDAPANISMISALLDGEFRIKAATRGQRALEIAAADPGPDLILLDIEMPEMDGYEVCQRLKADPRTADVPVIFLTGRTEVADETKGFDLGAVDYIHKPFSPAIVRLRVRTQLALRDAKAHAELSALESRRKAEKIEALLDSSGQGFLSFGTDRIIHPEFSAACRTMLGTQPAGADVVELLFPGDTADSQLVRYGLGRAMTEGNPLRREMLLSLLPATLRRDGRTLRLEYRPLPDGAMMLVITDVTEAVALEAAVDKERRRLEMIVNAVSDGRDFFSLVEDFTAFLAGIRVRGLVDPTRIDDFLRTVHTFKGVFGQFGFQHLPEALHALETVVDETGDAPIDVILRLGDALEADLAILRGSLGDAFVSARGAVLVPIGLADRLGRFAERFLSNPSFDTDTADLLRAVAALRKISVRHALTHFDRPVRAMASRLEKEVAPLAVFGDDILVDPVPFRPFLRSLVHVFRNAISHGIESPDIRLANGKNETGTVSCALSCANGVLHLAVSDDGAGIDEDRVRLKLAESLGGDAANALPRGEVLAAIFGDHLSTAETVDEFSGRGVGLGAVRAALADLNGAVTVTSDPGQGTRFDFRIPLPPGGGA